MRFAVAVHCLTAVPVVTAASLALLAGCEPPPQVEDPPVAVVEQALKSSMPPLFENPDLDTWLGWPGGFIDVCWEDENPQSTRAIAIRTGIESTWERYANLTFRGWRNCGPLGFGGHHIRIRKHLGAIQGGNGDLDGNAGIGRQFLNGEAAATIVTLRWDPTCTFLHTVDECLVAVAIHEFGHALGFVHPESRSDAVVNLQDISGRDDASVMRDSNRFLELSGWDIVGVQRAYGKKPPGTLSASRGNRCVQFSGFFDGARVAAVEECEPEQRDVSGQLWRYSVGDGTFTPVDSDALCLDDPNGNQVVGSHLDVRDCSRRANLRLDFRRLDLVGKGGQCVGHGQNNGDGLTIKSCADSGWTYTARGELRALRGEKTLTNLCMDVSDPRQVRTRTCNGSAAQSFVLTAFREIRPQAAAANGEPLCLELSKGDLRIDHGRPITARPCLPAGFDGPSIKQKDAQEFFFSGSLQGRAGLDLELDSLAVSSEIFPGIVTARPRDRVGVFFPNQWNYYFLP